MEEAKKKASVLVDNAATRMNYAYGLPVKTLYEFYFQKLELDRQIAEKLGLS
jgi:hypothetical protein